MQLSEECEGRWVGIYANHGLKQILNGKHQPCPICGGSDRFRFTNFQNRGGVFCNSCGPMDGIEFLQRFKGVGFKELADDLRQDLPTAQVFQMPNKDDPKKRARLRQMWREAKAPAAGDAISRYLESRCISLDSLPLVRLHEALPYFHDGQCLGKFPAMLALVSDSNGDAKTIHCTYLTDSGGKADVPVGKKLMSTVGEWMGGAIRLEELKDGQTLCVAEGIETALSIKTIRPDYCCWACINSNALAVFKPPANAGKILVAGDNDKNYTGQAAAYKLAHKINSTHGADVAIPVDDGTDWNDYLIGRRHERQA